MNRSSSAYINRSSKQLPNIQKRQNLQKATTTANLPKLEKMLPNYSRVLSFHYKSKDRNKNKSESITIPYENTSKIRMKEFNSIFGHLGTLLERYQSSLNLRRGILVEQQRYYFQKTEREMIKLDKKYGKRRLNCVHNYFKKTTEIDYRAGEKILDNVQQYYYRSYMDTLNPIFANSLFVVFEIFNNDSDDLDIMLKSLSHNMTNQKKDQVAKKFNYFVFIDISIRIEHFCENMFKDMNTKIDLLEKQLNKATRPSDLKLLIKELNSCLQLLNLNIEPKSIKNNEQYHKNNVNSFANYYKERLDYHLLNLKAAFIYFNYYIRVGKIEKGLAIIFMAIENKILTIRAYIDFYDKYLNSRRYLLSIIKGDRNQDNLRNTDRLLDFTSTNENWNYIKIIDDIKNYESRFEYVYLTNEYLKHLMNIHQIKDILYKVGEVALDCSNYYHAEKYLTITHYIIDNFEVPIVCKDMVRPDNITLALLKKMKTERRIQILELNKSMFHLNNQILEALIHNDKYEKALVCIINNYFIYKNSLKIIDDSDPSRYPKNDGGKNIILQEVDEYNLDMEEKIIFTKIFRFFKEKHVVLVDNYNQLWKKINSKNFAAKNNLFSHTRDIIVNLEKSPLYDYRAYHSFIERCELGFKVALDICDTENSYFPLYIGDYSEKIYEKFISEKVININIAKKRKNAKTFRISDFKRLKNTEDLTEPAKPKALYAVIKDNKLKAEDARFFFDIKCEPKEITDLLFRINLLHKYKTHVKSIEKNFTKNFEFVMSHFERKAEKSMHLIFTKFKRNIKKVIDIKKKKIETQKKVNYTNYAEYRMEYHAKRSQNKAQQIDAIKNANRRIYGDTNKKSIFANSYVNSIKTITRNYNLNQNINYGMKPKLMKSNSVDKKEKTPLIFFDRYSIVKSKYDLKTWKKTQKTKQMKCRRNNRRKNLLDIEALTTIKNALKNNKSRNRLENLRHDMKSKEELRYVDMIYSKNLISKMKFVFTNDMLLTKQNCKLKFEITESAIILKMIFVNSKHFINEDTLCLKFNLLSNNSLHNYALISQRLKYYTIIPVLHEFIVDVYLKHFFTHKDIKTFQSNDFLSEFVKKMGLVFPLLYVEFEKFTYEHLKNLSMGMYSNLDLNYLQSFFYILRFLSFYTSKSLYRSQFGVLNTRDFSLLELQDNVYFDISMTDSFILNKRLQETVFLYRKLYKYDVKKYFSVGNEAAKAIFVYKKRLRRHNIVKICLQNLINSMKIYKLFHSSRLKKQDSVNSIICNQIVKIKEEYYNFIVEIRISDTILMNYKTFFDRYMKTTINELRKMGTSKIAEIIEMIILVILLQKTLCIRFAINKVNRKSLQDDTPKNKQMKSSLFNIQTSRIAYSAMNPIIDNPDIEFLTLINFYIKELNKNSSIFSTNDENIVLEYLSKNASKINTFIIGFYTEPIHNVSICKKLCPLIKKLAEKEYFMSTKGSQDEPLLYFNSKKMNKEYMPEKNMILHLIQKLKLRSKNENSLKIDRIIAILDSLEALLISDFSSLKLSELENARDNIESKLEKEFKSKIMLKASNNMTKHNTFLEENIVPIDETKNNMFKDKFEAIAKNMVYGIKKQPIKRTFPKMVKIANTNVTTNKKNYNISRRNNAFEMRELQKQINYFDNYFIQNTEFKELSSFGSIKFSTKGHIGSTIYNLYCDIYYKNNENTSANYMHLNIVYINIKLREFKHNATHLTVFRLVRQELILYVLNIISQPKSLILIFFHQLINALLKYNKVNRNYYYSKLEEDVLLILKPHGDNYKATITTSSKKKSKLINNILPNFKVGAHSRGTSAQVNQFTSSFMNIFWYLLTRHLVLNYNLLVKLGLQCHHMTYIISSKYNTTYYVDLDIFIPYKDILYSLLNLNHNKDPIIYINAQRDLLINDPLDIFKYYIYVKLYRFFVAKESGIETSAAENIIDLESFFVFNISSSNHKFKRHRIAMNNNDISYYINKNYVFFENFLKMNIRDMSELTIDNYSHSELFNMLIKYITYHFEFRSTALYKKVYLKSTHKPNFKSYLSNCKINYEIDKELTCKKLMNKQSQQIKTLSKIVTKVDGLFVILLLIHNAITDFYILQVYIPYYRRRFQAKIPDSLCRKSLYEIFIEITNNINENKNMCFKFKEQRINIFQVPNIASFAGISGLNTIGSSIQSESFKTFNISSFVETTSNPNLTNTFPTDKSLNAESDAKLSELQSIISEISNMKHRSILVKELLLYLIENSCNLIKKEFYDFYTRNNYNVLREKIKLCEPIVNANDINRRLSIKIAKMLNLNKAMLQGNCFKIVSDKTKIVFKELLLFEMNFTRKGTIYQMNIYLTKNKKENDNTAEAPVLNISLGQMGPFSQISYLDTVNYNLSVYLFTKKKSIKDKVLFYTKNLNLKEVMNLKKHEKINELEENLLGKKLDMEYLISLAKFLSEKLITSNVFFISSLNEPGQQ